MIANDHAYVENAQVPPTYSVDLYEVPSVDFASQDSFFKKAADDADETSVAVDSDNDAAHSSAAEDSAAEDSNADDSDCADDDAENEDEDDDEDENDPNAGNAKNRVTKKSQLEKLKKRKRELADAADKIYLLGRQYQEDFHQQAFNKAIPGLAMILGTYRVFFDNANDEESQAFTKVLTQRCRIDLGKSSLTKADKRTTPFHLLSRLFRHSERRQASSDAQILRLAHKEGATQESFELWVKGYGSLSAILRKIRDESADPEETQPEKKRKERPFTIWIKAAEVPDDDAAGALAALKKLADGKRYTTSIYYHHGRFDVMRLIEKSSAETAETKSEEAESHEKA